jgi:asparagine synthase (glutamine-hydrolysing)
MCGIVGTASKDQVGNRDWLSHASDAIHHRGPDASGQWWSANGCVGLAHQRLAIIDLSPGGHQPMADRTNRLHVVFNGEIYNYRELRAELRGFGHQFSTESDTEVLLVAYIQWGEGFLSRLNGMFAFALYDSVNHSLLLARDRAGEKPLYYWERGGAIYFASELKALMHAPGLDRRIDKQAFDCYLGLGFVPGSKSILAQVSKLPPSHFLRFDLTNGTCAIRRYWAPPELSSTAEVSSAEDLVQELETLLQQSVERQLVADVPVGVLLSGGLDSSIVTALAARARTKVRTFTVRFPGGGRHDESAYAQTIASYFGTDHLTLDAEPSTVDILPLLAKQFDEPLIDSSMVPTYLVSRLIRQHCTVALGGDGGDELFGGYTHYDRLLRLQSHFAGIPRPLRSGAALLGSHLLPVGFRGANWLQAINTDFARDVPLIAGYFDRSSRQSLLGVDGNAAEMFWMQAMPKDGDLIQRATRMDFDNYLPEDILVKVDRASMLNSLEVRAPMLDKNVMEFAFQKVPSRLKTTTSARKILLRSLASKLLPPTFDVTRKQGFSIPISHWLESGPWLNFFKDVLLDSQQTTFNRPFVEKLFKGQGAGRSNGERLFGLVMFELWRREYQISI